MGHIRISRVRSNPGWMLRYLGEVGEMTEAQVADVFVEMAELFQLQTDQGPCVDCFRTGQLVSVTDLPAAGRWSQFTAAARDEACPMWTMKVC